MGGQKDSIADLAGVRRYSRAHPTVLLPATLSEDGIQQLNYNVHVEPPFNVELWAELSFAQICGNEF